MTENTDPVTVVVADDQSAVREGLVLLLGTVPGIAVVGEAEDGEAAVEAVGAKVPQVVLMDLNMPRLDGVEATRRVRASHPQTQVVVLTTYSDDESIIGALQAGALGYLTKDATRTEIGRAVLAAAAGQAVLDPEVQQRLLSAAVRAPAAVAAEPSEDDLTPARRRCSVSSLKANPTARSPGRCSSARPRSRRTSTGSSPRPARVTAARPPATPTRMATPTRPPRPVSVARQRAFSNQWCA
jgi:DNA-binding NarL/FixJ family response regulator